MSNLEKEINFIKEHDREIAPITDDPKTLRAIREISDSETSTGAIDQNKAEHILEEFETKVFSLDKSASRPGQKRVLVEADNPGAYAAIKPLISELEKDPRCSGITVLTSGVASSYLRRDFGNAFPQIREKDKPVLVDLLDAVKAKPVDIAFSTLSVKNAPDSVVLFGSKSNLGAKKLFLILESWGQQFNPTFSENRYNFDKIDGIFCNDELAKNLFLNHYPNFSEERVYSFGTPILDSLEVEHSEEYRRSGRQKLGIEDKTKVFLYLGAPSFEVAKWYGCREDIDEITLKNALEQIIQLAKENPDNNFVFAFRPHPRDSEKENKYKLAHRLVLPPNLSFKDAAPLLSMNEVAYSSDIILSIFSTENLFAPIRGRKGVFLSFSGQGMGRGVLEKVFGKEAVPILEKQSEAIRVVDSPKSLRKELAVLIAAADLGKPTATEADATKKILDIAFE